MAYITFKPNDYFDTKIYTAAGSTNNGNTQTMTMDNVGWVWMKNRGVTNQHCIFNILTGGNKIFNSAGYNAPETAGGAITFGASDTTIGGDTGGYGFNQTPGANYVAWHWRANGAGSANTAGSINSSVSANTTSGFSLVRYTGNGSAGATIGHGLGVAPKFIFVKSDSDNYNWTVYYGDATDYLVLNASDATTDSNEVWNDTAPSSTVFTVGNRNSTNQNTATFVAYCFAEKTGFSKFGSYEGNGSTDGPFVYTGFKPAFVMIKVTNGTDNWFIFDNRRSTSGGNVVDDYLYPNLSNAEGGTDILDFLSNGFKLRTTDGGQNGSSNYIYMAFAESPFTANVDGGLPTTAR